MTAATDPIDITDLPPDLRFLAGGGEATRMILARDWRDHPLGPPAAWPEALKVSLSTILNSPESMILSWGRDDLTFFFNETYFPLLGPRLSWAMGAPFTEVWADAWDQAKPIIDDAFAGRSQRFIDLPWKLATDRGVADTWWTFSYSRILGSDGAVAGLLIVTNETTERVLSDRRIAEAEEELERAQVAGGVGLFVVGRDAIIHPSANMCRLYGLEPAVAVPSILFEHLVVAEDRALTSTAESRAAGVVPLDVEYRIRRADTGEQRWIARRADVEMAADGSFVKMIGVVRDVTDQVAARMALVELNANLEAEVAARTADRNRIWQLSNDLLLVADLSGTIEAINPAWTRLLGWEEDELLGLPLLDLIHPDDLARTTQGVAAVASGNVYANFENRYRHKDGSYRDIRWTAQDGDGKIIGAGRDWTEERMRAEALALAEDQLRQAQKMEAVGQLTGGIAHDFNNMLTGVIGSLDLLKHHLAAGRSDRIDRYIDAAATSAQRAAGLTHRLLAFSRRQSLDVKAVDVNALVAGMEELLRRTLGENIGLEVVLHADAWAAMTDQNQLESALLNLAINARDAMPDGGRLTIETASTCLDATYVDRFDDLRAGEFVVVCVSDTGSGMSQDVIDKAFEPFFTTKPIGSGTGLGLSMIYGFAKQSGGHARIYSEVGRGTTVKLYLPRHAGASPAPAVGPVARLAAAAGEQILVVEDDPAVRLLVTDVLADLGYGVHQAGDARAALAQLDTLERIDLLITDVGLPGMDGRRLADAARERRAGLKVLFVTGYAERAAIRGEFLAEGMDMITKPFAIDLLSTKVREIIGS